MPESFPDPHAPVEYRRHHESEKTSAFGEIGTLAGDRLLVLLAGATALLFGLLAFVLAAADGQAFAPTAGFGTGGMVLTLVLTLFFGMLLLHAMVVMGRKPVEGAVLALAFSLVLLIFGGVAGMVGGILGLIGGSLALVRNAKWS